MVANWFIIFLLLLNNAAHFKYSLPKTFSDEENVKHYKSTLSAGYMIFGKNFALFPNEAPIHKYGPGTITSHMSADKNNTNIQIFAPLRFYSFAFLGRKADFLTSTFYNIGTKSKWKNLFSS